MHAASMQAPSLSFDALKLAVAAGEIDTVLACMVDMQGRLIGKRFQAESARDAAEMVLGRPPTDAEWAKIGPAWESRWTS